MATATKADVYVANTSFASSFLDGGVDEKGNPTYQTITALVGKRYRADHPLVKQNPEYFDLEGSPSPIIEAATAAPGEVRGA